MSKDLRRVVLKMAKVASILKREVDTRAQREVRRRYPDYTGAPDAHPDYQGVRSEMIDFVLDMWYREPWRTAEGEDV